MELGATVQSVDWSRAECCRVLSCDLSGQQREWTADAVLCTASLGVLKSGSIAFSPPLPETKRAAIGRLGFGCLNKLVLEFESAFWLDEDVFGCVREAQDARGRLYMFWNIHRVTDRPVLVALMSGDSAWAAEQCEDEQQLVDECRQLLSRMTGRPVPQPVSWRLTRWGADPLARGSYSYVAVGATEQGSSRLRSLQAAC